MRYVQPTVSHLDEVASMRSISWQIPQTEMAIGSISKPFANKRFLRASLSQARAA